MAISYFTFWAKQDAPHSCVATAFQLMSEALTRVGGTLGKEAHFLDRNGSMVTTVDVPEAQDDSFMKKIRDGMQNQSLNGRVERTDAGYQLVFAALG